MGQRDGKPGALILGGHFLSLGAVRNLARHGVRTFVADRGPCVSQFSRYCSGLLRCPPEDDEHGLVDYLIQVAADRGLSGWVLFPSTDEGVRILSQHRERLAQNYVVTTPGWETTRYLYDKRLTNRLAVQQEVPVPFTYVPGSQEGLQGLDLEFPVVLKPAITTHFTSVTKKKAYRADDFTELSRLYAGMAEVIDPAEIVIQELIPGRAQNLFSFAGLFQDGTPVAAFAARRPRQHPMEFGRASTLAEMVEAPELETLATRLLQGIGYTGLAEVEFMWDPRHGRYELLEVNPRIWGWHAIAIKAGVDLPYLAYMQALGEDVVAGPFRKDVKWLRLLTDLPAASGEILNGRLSISDYWRSMRGPKEFAVFSLSDPLPFIMEPFLIPYYTKHRGF